MPDRPTAESVPPPGDDQASISDDECLQRLAEAVQHHDASQQTEPLDEVARLIGRLAVTIE
jgi:hypothetical protein